jgi:GPH family glycoside/pentoside/hexuronide:cation symporter
MEKVTEKVSMKEKLSWGLGGFSEQIAVNGLNNMFMPVFNMGFGLDSKLIGWAISIPRFFDMISDPLIGNMSDNCRSRFGRRRPFILVGGILMALVFGLTYMASPYMGQWAMFAYATIACILFYLAYTIYSVPYTALGLELTDDYDERAHIQKYRLIFSSLATFAIPWIYPICLKVGERAQALAGQDQVAWFEKPLTLFPGLAADVSIKAEVLGSRYVAWACALFIVLAILPVSFAVKERGRMSGKEKIGLLTSVKLVSKNKPFAFLLGMILLVITGMYFINPLLLYMNIFYVHGGDKSAGGILSGMFGSTQAIVMFISSFIVPYLVQILDKKKVLMIGLSLGALASFLNLFLVNPAHPKLQLISAAILGFGMSCCWLLNGAFIADVCDADELAFGYRREGMFSASFGFVVKLAFTVIGVALGYLIAVAGYEAGADIMTPETVKILRYFLVFFPMSCLILAAITMKFYPLTRERIHEIQRQLNERTVEE